MSLQTWKAEFYPTYAKAVSGDDAIAHSLRKWRGLTPENVAKHELHYSSVNAVLVEHEGLGRFDIGGDTCALCYWHHADDPDEDEDGEEVWCAKCPLAIVRGGKACDQERDDEAFSPWHEFTRKGDPKPMIFWLEKAEAAHEAQ